MGDISFMPKSIDFEDIVKENIELIKRKLDQKNIILNLDIEKNSIALADENMRYDNDKNSKTRFEKVTTEYSVDSVGEKKILRKWVNGNPIEIHSTDFEIEVEDGVKFSSSFADQPGEYIYGKHSTTTLWTKLICKTTQL